MSYKLEVHGVGDSRGHFVSNTLRFATEAEAHDYEKYISFGRRWFGYDDSRVVESTDPVNYKFDSDSMTAVPIPEEPPQSVEYHCRKCGAEISESDADDNDGLCNNCGSMLDENGNDWTADDYEVDIIASGYEWTCPKCDKLVHEIEYKAHVTCPDCDITFKTGLPEHAYE